MAERGWVVFERQLESAFVERLIQSLDAAYERCRHYQREKGIAPADGAVHHLPCFDESFVEVLERAVPHAAVEHVMGARAIVNSFGGVVNGRADRSYLHHVHRDVRTFLPGPPAMINMLVMLDPFTEENGATYLLNGSHRRGERPDDARFFAEAARLIGPSGSVVLFDSRLWHAAGANRSDHVRRALTLTFTPPYFKPQLDYARFLGDARARTYSADVRQLLGYNARVPVNLDEWYQPVEHRFYQADQG